MVDTLSSFSSLSPERRYPGFVEYENSTGAAGSAAAKENAGTLLVANENPAPVDAAELPAEPVGWFGENDSPDAGDALPDDVAVLVVAPGGLAAAAGEKEKPDVAELNENPVDAVLPAVPPAAVLNNPCSCEGGGTEIS